MLHDSADEHNLMRPFSKTDMSNVYNDTCLDGQKMCFIGWDSGEQSWSYREGERLLAYTHANSIKRCSSSWWHESIQWIYMIIPNARVYLYLTALRACGYMSRATREKYLNRMFQSARGTRSRSLSPLRQSTIGRSLAIASTRVKLRDKILESIYR